MVGESMRRGIGDSWIGGWGTLGRVVGWSGGREKLGAEDSWLVRVRA